MHGSGSARGTPLGLGGSRPSTKRFQRLPRWPQMQARPNDLKDSFYLYIMRASIGAGLRSRYTPNAHLPDELAELLRNLDRPGDQIAQEKRNPPRMRKHTRWR
jgi:hypothetical protein